MIRRLMPSGKITSIGMLIGRNTSINHNLSAINAAHNYAPGGGTMEFWQGFVAGVCATLYIGLLVAMAVYEFRNHDIYYW